MELIDIWHLLKRRWWLIVLPAAVAFMLTIPQLSNMVSPETTYWVQIRLTAAAPPEAEIEGVTTPYEDTVYVPLLASEYVVVNMPHWITSDSFAREVSQVLTGQNATFTADDLEGKFHADSFRSILQLYVTWDNREELETIADAAVTVLQTRNQTYFPQFAAEPVEVVALDDVEITEVAPPITTRVMPLLRIIFGGVLGVGLAVLAEYLDNAVRTRADIETLGMAVLGEIPPERRRRI
ncbi:MAG: hypothetical protein JW966_00840 [Anaerolineae bacterium]|nr:hypothetical protein [Anaerolineae bacterium]